MTALLLAAFVAAAAANVALVPLAADCLSSKSNAPVSGSPLFASNENDQVAVTSAA